MYLSSEEIFIKLNNNDFLNQVFKFTYTESHVYAEIRIGGFFCNLVIQSGIKQKINIESRNDYTKKILRELFTIDTIDLYIYFEKNIKDKFYIKKLFNRKDFYLSKICTILEKAYNFLFNNIVTLNTTFRIHDTINNIGHINTAFYISDKFKHINMNMIETMDHIYKEELSLSRYGDGELNLVINQNNNISFQKNSILINEKLIEILSNTNDNLLVCLPNLALQNNFWRDFWFKKLHLFAHHCNQSLYGNAQVTRPIFFQKYGVEATEAWKRIWRNKSVCFIYGEGSRFEKNHFLFDEISSYSEILGKPSNAFEDLDLIIKQSVNLAEKTEIYLIALGPTGTILASELSKLGLRALDIGHLPNSYDNVFKNGKNPEALPVNRL